MTLCIWNRSSVFCAWYMYPPSNCMARTPIVVLRTSPFSMCFALCHAYITFSTARSVFCRCKNQLLFAKASCFCAKPKLMGGYTPCCLHFAHLAHYTMHDNHYCTLCIPCRLLSARSTQCTVQCNLHIVRDAPCAMHYMHNAHCWVQCVHCAELVVYTVKCAIYQVVQSTLFTHLPSLPPPSGNVIFDRF